MSFHRLHGQNLLRHKLIQEELTGSRILLSDSASLSVMIAALFLPNKIVVHALELYSISYAACISEYKYRWSIIRVLSLKGFRSIFGLLIRLARVLILTKVASRAEFVIVSSCKRASFLVENGANYKIEVLRNKPVYSDAVYSPSNKQRIIVVIGNMYGKYREFMLVHKFALENDYQVQCYGVTKEDKIWLSSVNLDNVFVFERLDLGGVIDVLRVAKYAMCLYPDTTVNNIFSASSKVFEALYFRAVPIVSNNEGLIFELESMNAPYVMTEGIGKHVESDLDHLDGVDIAELCFTYELSGLVKRLGFSTHS